MRHPIDRYQRLVGEPHWSRLPREDRRTVAVALAVMVLSVSSVLYLLRWSQQVEFEAVAPSSARGSLSLTCQNNRPYPITLFAPWEERSGSIIEEVTYGVELQFRSEGERRWRMLPTSEAWYYQGMSTSRSGPIQVSPGLAASLYLRLGLLQSDLPAGAALRVVCRKSTGKRIFTFHLPAFEESITQ